MNVKNKIKIVDKVKILDKIARFLLFQNIKGNGSISIEDQKFYDKPLLLTIICILIFGFIMVVSSSIKSGVTDNFFHSKIILSYLIPIFAFITCFFIPIKYIQKYIWLLVLLCILSLLMVVFIAPKINGASRWLNLGIMHFQPSEFAKLVMCIYLANYIHSVNHVIKHFNQLTSIASYIIILAIVGVLLLLQPDFGTLLAITIISLCLFIITCINIRALVLFIPLTFVVIIVFGLFVYFYGDMLNYLERRIANFWYPFSDPSDKTYQLANSLSAIGRSNFWGTGLGNSIGKLSFLPYANTDYIFAIISEELGIFGIVLTISLYILLIIRLFKISYESILIHRKNFQGLMVLTFLFWIAYQAAYNILMVYAFLPTDGATLPLISYGGSSLLVFLIALGISLRVDYENRKILDKKQFSAKLNR